MARPTPLSGFPEWLPDGRIVEQHVLDVLRRTFELHGFAGIETRAVEPLDQLLRKGETSKEVYVLRRLQEEAGRRAGPRRARSACTSTSPCRSRGTCWRTPGTSRSRSGATRSRRCGAASGPRTAGSASSCRPTSTSSGAGALPYHYEVELPAGDGRGARRAARDRRAAGADPGEQPQGRRGLLPRARADRRRGACCAASTSSTRSAPTRSPRCWSRRRVPTRTQAARVPRARVDQRVRRVRGRPGARAARATSNELLDEGLGGARRAHPRGGRARARRRRRRPEDRPRPRLLHRLGLRDRPGRARAARLDLLGRPLRHARVRRRRPPTPASACRSACPAWCPG